MLELVQSASQFSMTQLSHIPLQVARLGGIATIQCRNFHHLLHRMRLKTLMQGKWTQVLSTYRYWRKRRPFT